MTPSNPDPDRRDAGSSPEDAGNGTTKQKIKQDAEDAKQEVGAQAREKAEAGKHRLADEADNLSDAIDAAASNLDDHDRQGLARYARELSTNIANAAGQLEGRTVDELADDAKRLARDNPALFMLGSIAVGFGLSRFFKASAERDHHDDKVPRDDNVPADMPGQRRQPDMGTYATSTAPHGGNGREMP